MFHSRHFSINQLAEGIYVLIASEQGGAMSNAGIIDMGGFTLVFDTFNTPQAGRDLREAALHLLAQPIGYVVNSHWHGDHVRGNQCFPGVSIVSSARTRELMQITQPQWLDRMTPLLPQLNEDIAAAAAAAVEAEQDDAARQQLTARHSYLLEIRESIETLIVTYPGVTYGNQLWIHGSKRSGRLFSLGRAHTECDSVLHLAADSMLFAGDAVAVNNHPLLTDGDPHGWLSALETLGNLDTRCVVPGHGPVSDTGSITSMEQYINDLLAICSSYRSLESKPTAAEIPIPEAYRSWDAAAVFQRNLEFLLDRQL
ncbi:MULTISPECIES: MBL fold metallo-hydrolase [unclassified Paenibacillus]|nr:MULTISPECIES: MBL fold metallo-hydrolase [unclassified Paenibacillus]MDF9841617.1 cyclase [Paenibacillus sp. PastF-2]MDF9848271.1 cyclase [Paenibacillus sp. PastM-2]MDF9854776.1 cyclase [Paenibacillus sp. PastF-1]MDH6480046.1 cyclase [Paenibacillus sp. PastH-2]